MICNPCREREGFIPLVPKGGTPIYTRCDLCKQPFFFTKKNEKTNLKPFDYQDNWIDMNEVSAKDLP